VTRIRKAVALPLACLAIAAAVIASAQIPVATLKQANDALQAGEADRALSLLTPLPAQGQGAAEAQNLLCRVRFMLQQWDPAEKACELAAQLDAGNSIDHMWLGRALGEKASRASFLTAYSLGKRVRSEFEQAVQLDPHNADALSNLGEFYKDAPAIVGGGTDKAAAIAAQLDKVDPAKAFMLRGNIDVARKDYVSAERDFKHAIAVSPHPAEQWTILANFYRNQKRWSDVDAAIQSCVTAAARDKHSGVGLYDGAGILIETKRNPALAAKMLEDYLAGSSKSEEAPAFIAHARLGQLKQQLGDAAGVQQEFAAATAMAREYNPAQVSK
jgi:tetratricopeptide (TPR) repeat protein